MTDQEIKPQIRAVVFDLDGLMFNTEEVFFQSGTELLRRRNKPFTQECHHQMLGRRPLEAFQIMIDLMDLSESIEELREESEEIFQAVLKNHLAPMPGLFDLLDKIEQRQLPKGVATSSPRDYLEGILTRFDLLHRFAFTLTAEDVTDGKPHPEIYLKAAENLGVPPGEMMVLEDSEIGSRAAAAAGAVVVSIPHEHTRAQDFSMATEIATSLHAPEVLRYLH